MERILWLYALSYQSEYPVLCFDERPCQLLGEVIEPRAMKPGKVRKEHATYERNGTCALLAAIEPLTGKRFGLVTHQRTKKEYAEFCRDLAAQYPNAKKIRLVQDNLNTHHAGSFYEHLPVEEAFALAQRFEFYYTPKSASWLNMIEIEFSALARQCLKRRIPDIHTLARQVTSLIKRRNQKRIKISWQFSIKKARTKLRSHYDKLGTAR